MTEASHEKFARCNGDGFYFRVPDNFNPFSAGGFATARAAYKVTCSRVIALPPPVSRDAE